MSTMPGAEHPEAGLQPGEVLLCTLRTVSGAVLQVTSHRLVREWLAADGTPQQRSYPTSLVSATVNGTAIVLEVRAEDGRVVEQLRVANEREAAEAVTALRLAAIEIAVIGRLPGADRRGWARVEAELGRARDRSAVAMDVLADDLRALRYDVLFPIRSWLADRIWSLSWVQALLFLALAPIVVSLLLGSTPTVGNAVLLLGFYFASVWGMVLYRVIGPRRFDPALTAAVALFTGIIGVGVLVLMGRLPPFSWLSAATDSDDSVIRSIGFLLGVGLPEELTKAAPIIFLALKLKRIHAPRDAAFFGGVSGLAFGVSEAVVYSLLYAEASRTTVLQFGRFLSGDVLYGGYLMVQTIRLISLPFLHCIWSSIAGYYLGLACLHPSRAAGLVTIGVVTAAILHGVYDLFAGGWIGLLVFGLSILLFAGYTKSADEIGEALAAQGGPPPPPALLAADTPDVP